MTKFSNLTSLAVWLFSPLLILGLSTVLAEEQEFAEEQPLAVKSLLLDITAVGNSWVAVGERGHILLSADGSNWKQASNVPSKATLTSVFSLEDKLWAAGHEATILSSSDGGNTWELQFQDMQADPIMDIVFISKQQGFALGAYGQLLVTLNGGQDWDFLDLNEVTIEAEFAATDDSADDEENNYAAALEDLGCYETLECHLNAMVVMSNQRLMMIGERGYGFRSRDNGKQWQAIHLPYEGSMFGALLVSDECVLAFGLRGHAFRSCDFGSNWVAVDTGTQSSLLSGALGPRTVQLVGASGVLVKGSRTSLKLTPETLDSGIDYTAIVLAGRKRSLMTSTEGILVNDPQANQATNQAGENQ
ncbi:MAG: YCF48-related protein [Xanthomonadales bacterium]|nr:YCF48-related protein [Xanthomonadales bacterium]